MNAAIKNHSRLFETNLYVYPVISRRSGGLSIGINMNPDKLCNFNCVYCQVDRTLPGIDPKIDIAKLNEELRDMLALYQSGILSQKMMPADFPKSHLKLTDIALSGDGEPTLCKNFSAVCQCVNRIRSIQGQPSFKLVLITNTTGLHLAEVQKGLELFRDDDEIWAKLDAGTDAYFQLINRTHLKLESILKNIALVGKKRPVIVQSLFLEYRGEGPTETEIGAYIGKLSWLKEQGCKIKLVQVYSVARPPTESEAKSLPKKRLEQIADEVRKIGLRAEAF